MAGDMGRSGLVCRGTMKRGGACVARIMTTLMLFGCLLCVSSPARANKIERLIRTLTHERSSDKERVGAVVLLDKHRKLPTMAALKSVLHRCGTVKRTSRFYLDLSKVRVMGPHKALVRFLVQFYFYRRLSGRTGIVLGMPGCRKPPVSKLRRWGVRGYYLGTVATHSNRIGSYTLKIRTFFTSYKGRSVKGSVGGTATLKRRFDRTELSFMIDAIAKVLVLDIRTFLRGPASPGAWVLTAKLKVRSPNAVPAALGQGQYLGLPPRTVPSLKSQLRWRETKGLLRRANKAFKARRWARSHTLYLRVARRGAFVLRAYRRLAILKARLGDLSGALRLVETIRKKAGDTHAHRTRVTIRAALGSPVSRSVR